PGDAPLPSVRPSSRLRPRAARKSLARFVVVFRREDFPLVALALSPVVSFSPSPALPPWPAWLSFDALSRRLLRPAELRIDVDPKEGRPSEPLTPVYERMRAMGDRVQGLPALRLDDPDLHARFREADGETYVYIEDVRHQRLVGYTVFNRLIELDRRAD